LVSQICLFVSYEGDFLTLIEEALTYSVLLDESTTRSGDLYIRSICFSPDGKFLATGAEDRQIRVCPLLISLIHFSRSTIIKEEWKEREEREERMRRQGKKKRNANSRSGTSKPVESDPSSQATCKKSIPSISPEMVDSSFLDLAIKALEYGILRRALVYLI
jgi:WD40 repeat protein